VLLRDHQLAALRIDVLPRGHVNVGVDVDVNVDLDVCLCLCVHVPPHHQSSCRRLSRRALSSRAGPLHR
jgi:hypothetical protein